MKLLGNSVSIPVVEALCKAIIDTKVFEDNKGDNLFCKNEYHLASFDKTSYEI
jgi:hypothetical protein